jgi:hypothetical protein
MPVSSRESALKVLISRMAEKRSELEASVLNRVYGISDAPEPAEGEYAEGLREAVRSALDHGYLVIERGPDRELPPVPPQLVVQARLAARSNVSLDLVLRRYLAGHTLFSDLLLAEGEAAQVPRSELKRLFRALASSLDRLLATVSGEYMRELSAYSKSNEERSTKLVEALLAGELLDPIDLRYDINGWNLGLVASSPSVAAIVNPLAKTLDRSTLQLDRGAGTLWVWLGGRRPFEPEEQEQIFERLQSLTLAPTGIGEPAQGLAGWRLTHRQALATMALARRSKTPVLRYAEAPLLAFALQDDLLATSLRALFLAPLEQERDSGVTAKQTLRAYLAASGNASSAAAALGVSRQTISSRLAMIEERLGRPLDSAWAEIATALRLDEIEDPERSASP